MKFLITNDDGIDAPGIKSLANVALQFGDVIIVAPDRAHSGCGHRVTSDGPISIEQHSDNAWSISGTPADCARVGLHEIADDVDWVLSGINLGANLGVDVFMSGTVAAVREGALLGRPGIGISHYRRSDGKFDWERAEGFVKAVLERLIAEKLPAESFWNVNLPDLTGSDATPDLVDCPLATKHLPVSFERDGDTLRYRGDYHARPTSPGDDVDVCFAGNIAISRLSIWGAR